MNDDRGTILILTGPLISVACVALAIVSETGSGLFVLAVMSAVAYMLVPPILQIILLATETFSGRYWLTCGIGLGVATGLLLIPYLNGVFNAG